MRRSREARERAAARRKAKEAEVNEPVEQPVDHPVDEPAQTLHTATEDGGVSKYRKVQKDKERTKVTKN
ncbi:MAG: hypothetical protein HFJ91_04870 [Muribaculaceae bacterium]|nr:hypothetical protein [Muribaculaceae bacterium]